MARSFLALVLIPLLPLAPVFAAPAEPTPSASPTDSPAAKPAPAPEKWDRPRKGDRPKEDGRDPFKHFQKKLEQMGPREREQLKENWKRWKGMGNRERHDWQRRAGEQRERMEKVIDDAIAKTGLTLTDDEREVFVVRYRQERRKVEEELRREMDAQREQRMAAVLAGLKTEFAVDSAKPAASPSPTP